MTTEKPSRFEAIYRIEASGETVWFIHLENNQVVVIRQEEIRFYATRKSMDDGDEPTATISRIVEPDAQVESEDGEQRELL